MNITRRAALFAAVSLLPLASVVQAHDFTAGDLQIGHPWTRATARAGATAGAFMTIRNKGRTADRLLGVESGAADRLEIHESRMENNVMQMRPVQAIEIPAGGEVRLAPGGLHVMLFGTKQQFQQGQTIPVTLRFERAGRVLVELAVEAPGANPMGHGAPAAGQGAAPAQQHTH